MPESPRNNEVDRIPYYNVNVHDSDDWCALSEAERTEDLVTLSLVC